MYVPALDMSETSPPVWRINLLVILAIIASGEGGEVSQFTIIRSILSIPIAYHIWYGTPDFIDKFIQGRDHQEEGQFRGNQLIPFTTIPLLPIREYIPLYLGAFIYAIGVFTGFIVLKDSLAKNFGLAQPCVPILVVIIVQWLGLEPVSPSVYLCIILSLLGFCISIDSFGEKTDSASKAALFVCLKLSSSKLNNSFLHVYLIAGQTLLNFPLALLYYIFADSNSIFDLGFSQFLYSLLSSFLIVYFLWKVQIWGIRLIGITRVSLFNVITPCLTSLLDYIFIGDKFSVNFIIGALIVVLSIIIQVFTIKFQDDDSTNLEMRTRLLTDL